jgi:hypothetical protein
MKTKFLVFCIAEDAYLKVHHYRQEMDYRIIKNQIDRKGMALIRRYRGKDGLNHIRDLPEIGEAVPWYGTFGAGFSFTIRNEKEGSSLKVECLASEFSLLCSEKLLPLELHLSDGAQYRESIDQILKETFRLSIDAFIENEEDREIYLVITPESLQLLTAWPSWGEPLTQYEFVFNPSSVGCAVLVQHVGSGESINLSKDENW